MPLRTARKRSSNWNMALEEEIRRTVPDARASLKCRARSTSEMQRKFFEWDASHSRDSLVELRGLLNRRKYISNLIDKTNVPD